MSPSRSVLSPPPPQLLLLLLLLHAGASLPPMSATSLPGGPPSRFQSAYEALQSYDFPVGLLPQGAVGYELEPSTGRFSAYLNGSCSFSLVGSYQLRYRSTISGYISQDHLRELNGVSVKVLFFWVNIIEVTRNGDNLQFSVGIASADFSIDDFLQSPQCGCGFDCVSTLPPAGKEGPRVKWRMASS